MSNKKAGSEPSTKEQVMAAIFKTDTASAVLLLEPPLLPEKSAPPHTHPHPPTMLWDQSSRFLLCFLVPTLQLQLQEAEEGPQRNFLFN